MPGVMIRTFLVDGTPDGLRTYEISNSTVHATVFPRPSLDRFLKRDPAQRPGVYVLLGQDPEVDSVRIYVGEGDPAGPRLQSHGSKKDFWTQAIVFTSKDDYLTKTQIQFLEARLVTEARAAGRVAMENGNSPGEPRIWEASAVVTTQVARRCYQLLGGGAHQGGPNWPAPHPPGILDRRGKPWNRA